MSDGTLYGVAAHIASLRFVDVTYAQFDWIHITTNAWEAISNKAHFSVAELGYTPLRVY